MFISGSFNELAFLDFRTEVVATVFEDSWHQPFSTDRIRRRPPYSAANNQFAAFVQFSFAEVVRADKWFVQFSEPVRLSRRLPTSSQQFASFVQFSPFAERVSVDKWFPSLSEPSRSRKPMHTGSQQFASFIQFAPFTERVSADKWFVPFSEPIRYRQPRVSLYTGAQQFASFVNYAPFDIYWLPSLTEPSRFRKPMHTGAQQFASFVQFAPFNELVSADRWFVPFSEPIRFRRALLTANQWFGRGIETPLTAIIIELSATIIGTSNLTGVPTSNYKLLLSQTSRRLIYAAEISPWTISSRDS